MGVAGTWTLYHEAFKAGPVLMLERDHPGERLLRKDRQCAWLGLSHDEIAVILGGEHLTLPLSTGPGVYLVYMERTKKGLAHLLVRLYTEHSWERSYAASLKLEV